MALPVTLGELLKKIKERRANVVIITKSGSRLEGRIGQIFAEYFQLDFPDQGAGTLSAAIRIDAIDHIPINDLKGLE